MFRRLAYTSVPRPNLPAAEIPRIIASSRTHNVRDGMCGVLVYTGHEFAQLIEGAPEKVERLWQRIQADARHVELVILLDELDRTRWFNDWRIGYLADRALIDSLASWRARGRCLDGGERDALRRLFAAADSL